MSKLMLIDGNSLAYRAFYALPQNMATSSGQPTNAVLGFTRMLMKLWHDHNPDQIVVVFDRPEPTFRHKIAADYKGTRRPTPDSLRKQMATVREMTEALALPTVAAVGYEADDVIATLATEGRDAGIEVMIVTGDRDAYQLVEDPLVKVLYTKRGVSECDTCDETIIKERTGVLPEDYVACSALRGDKSDNLPGVPGVGEKTAAKLINDWGDLEGVFAALDQLPPRHRANLADHEQQVRLNAELMRLVRDVPLNTGVEDLRRGRIDTPALDRLFDHLEFWSIKKDLAELLGDELDDSWDSGRETLDPVIAVPDTASEAADALRNMSDVTGTGAGSATGMLPAGGEHSEKTGTGTGAGSADEADDTTSPVLENRFLAVAVHAGGLRAGLALVTDSAACEVLFIPGQLLEDDVVAAELARMVDGRCPTDGRKTATGDGACGQVDSGNGAAGGSDYRIALHDAKAFMRSLLKRGIDMRAPVFDTMLAAYLLNPTDARYRLDALAYRHARVQPQRRTTAAPDPRRYAPADRRSAATKRSSATSVKQSAEITVAAEAQESAESQGRFAFDESDTQTSDTQTSDTGESKTRDAGAVKVADAVREAAWAALAVDRLAGKLWRQLVSQGQESQEQAGGASEENGAGGAEARCGESGLQHSLADFYREIEVPLVRVLARMEHKGIGVDRPMLERIRDQLKTEADELREAIVESAGRGVNVNSPKQLSNVLFGDIGLQPVKRTKTGFSTDARSLRKLQGQHPIIDLILEYREVEKLRSTYGVGLLGEIAADNRIHATFSQTVARTGRLSSDDPNLHNIPVRTDRGRVFRTAFTAPEGYRLLVADYDQIELRCIAHLAREPKLTAAFESGEDIHAATAAWVFGIEPNQVDSERRSAAKMISYGLIYGMEAYGLGERLNMPTGEAAKILEDYFAAFSALRAYIDHTVEQARRRGYAETLFKRRRQIPDLNSSNQRRRQAAERQAMNTGVQGLAADIFKIALVRLDAALEEHSLDSRIVLQVHDEIILESPVDEVKAASEIVRHTMRGACDLSVPLEVHLRSAHTWADAKT